MRYLTIKRQKSAVASLCKVKVYIEDYARPELEINGVPCCMLGTLKNGEEKVFEIENNAAKLFAIAGKASKNYCNDFFQLGEGADNVYLSGGNVYNPANGNAFLFNNNETPETKANRRKGSIKGFIILVAVISIGSILGALLPKLIFGDNDKEIKATVTIPTAKTFVYSDMSITLTDLFVEKEGNLNCDVIYLSANVGVGVTKEPLYTIESYNISSVNDYAYAFIETNGYDSTVMTDGNLTWFDYTAGNNNITYYYRAYVFGTSDAMWAIQFYTLSDQFASNEAQIAAWAKTVTFN